VETKAHLCFLKKVGGRCGCVYGTEGALWVCIWNRGGAVGVYMEPRGRCGCVYGTEGAVDRKSLGTAVLDDSKLFIHLPLGLPFCSNFFGTV
jgi:hypothetical protein